MREQVPDILHQRQDSVQLAPELAAGLDKHHPGYIPVAAERPDIHTLQLLLLAGSGLHWRQRRNQRPGWHTHVSFGHGRVPEPAHYHVEAHWVPRERLRECELVFYSREEGDCVSGVADRSPLDPGAGSSPAELPFKLLYVLP